MRVDTPTVPPHDFPSPNVTVSRNSGITLRRSLAVAGPLAANSSMTLDSTWSIQAPASGILSCSVRRRSNRRPLGRTERVGGGRMHDRCQVARCDKEGPTHSPEPYERPIVVERRSRSEVVNPPTRARELR